MVTNKSFINIKTINNSMDPKNQKTLESFVMKFEEVLRIIKNKDYDCIIAPMFGAVPFIDILNIIDEEFQNEKVEYIPASNKVYRIREVLREAFQGIIGAYTPNGGSFISLDEVISGNSLQRIYKQFEAAKINYANKKTAETYGVDTDFNLKQVREFRDSIIKSIRYTSIGIMDPKMDRMKRNMNPAYKDLVENGIVIPIKTEGIVTMDNIEFFPAKYKVAKDDQGKTIYLPVVDAFNISSIYIDFLKNVAEILGKNPEEVTVRNIGKIRDSYKWVPSYLRSV